MRLVARYYIDLPRMLHLLFSLKGPIMRQMMDLDEVVQVVEISGVDCGDEKEAPKLIVWLRSSRQS